MTARVTMTSGVERGADRGDTQAAASARVVLKLGAEGYWACRHGVDAGDRLLTTAIVGLSHRALHYYEQLNQRRLPEAIRDRLRELHDHPSVNHALAQLQIAALSYAGTRIGSDACAEFSRAALGELCEAACVYTETLLETVEHDRPDRGRQTHEEDPPHVLLGNGREKNE